MTSLTLARQIRALKASWHADGSWPLRGSDEGPASHAETSAQEVQVDGSDNTVSSDSASATDAAAGEAPVQAQAPQGFALSSLPRSRWPARMLLRPPRVALDAARGVVVLPKQPEAGPPARPDPSPRQIARMYARGLARQKQSLLAAQQGTASDDMEVQTRANVT